MSYSGAEDVHGLHGLRLVPAAGGGRGHAGAGHGRGRVEADGAARQHPEVRLLMSCHAHVMSPHVMLMSCSCHALGIEHATYGKFRRVFDATKDNT